MVWLYFLQLPTYRGTLQNMVTGLLILEDQMMSSQKKKKTLEHSNQILYSLSTDVSRR